jgi:DNA-directed RNA polymerase specialized sigma24 family protein
MTRHEQLAAPTAGADVTAELHRWGAGDAAGFDAAFEAVYPRLQEIARHRLRLEPAEQTLNTTALVHEAYLRLAGVRGVAWQNR